MLPLDVPPDTTIETLVTRVIPEVHARWVSDDAPSDALSVAVRIEGRGRWPLHIQGEARRAAPGGARRPTLWVHTTKESAEHFLEDAKGPKTLLPKVGPGAATSSTAKTLSDPRVVRRVALASGRIELAVLDAARERVSIVFGFGDAARRPIDAEDPDTIVEVSLATLQGILQGKLAPDEALTRGQVTVRGSRLLAMQLALAIAPLYPRATKG